jgi:archaellum component FlaC
MEQQMAHESGKLSVDQRFDEMISLVTRGFHNTDNSIRELRTEVGYLGAELGVLKQDVGGLKQDVGELKERVGRVEEEIGGLKKEFVDFKTTTARNFQDVNLKIDFVRDELLKIDLVVRYEEQYKKLRGLPR